MNADMVIRFFEFLLPKEALENEEIRRLSVIVIAITLIFLPLASIYSLIYWMLGNWISGTLLALYAIVLLMILTCFRKFGSYAIWSRVIEVGVFVNPLAAYLTSGNVGFSVMFWFLYAPMTAMMTTSTRWTIIWAFGGFTTVTGMNVCVALFDIPMFNLLDHTNTKLMTFLDWFHFFGVYLSVLIVVIVFEVGRKKAVKAERDSYEKMIQAKNQLSQSEKLSSIGQMVAGVAHEVNSPRASVDHYLTLTEKQIDKILAVPQLPDTAKSPATTIKDSYLPSMNLAVTRIGELTNGLLNFTRADHKEMKEADLHQIMDSVLVLLKGKLHNRIQIKKDYGDIPQVMCYPGQINQVFMNILTNAVQAMPEAGGDITIKTWQENHHVSVSIR
ncbi:hypothetical protein HUU42_15735, partial [bacterium]|nr:hypothetical protein [bacterium]